MNLQVRSDVHNTGIVFLDFQLLANPVCFLPYAVVIHVQMPPLLCEEPMIQPFIHFWELIALHPELHTLLHFLSVAPTRLLSPSLHSCILFRWIQSSREARLILLPYSSHSLLNEANICSTVYEHRFLAAFTPARELHMMHMHISYTVITVHGQLIGNVSERLPSRQSFGWVLFRKTPVLLL